MAIVCGDAIRDDVQQTLGVAGSKDEKKMNLELDRLADEDVDLTFEQDYMHKVGGTKIQTLRELA